MDRRPALLAWAPPSMELWILMSLLYHWRQQIRRTLLKQLKTSILRNLSGSTARMVSGKGELEKFGIFVTSFFLVEVEEVELVQQTGLRLGPYE